MKTSLNSISLLLTLFVLFSCKSDFEKYSALQKKAELSQIIVTETLEGFDFEMDKEAFDEKLNLLKSNENDYNTYYWQLGDRKYAGSIYKKNFCEGKLCYYEIWIKGQSVNGKIKTRTKEDIAYISKYYKTALKKGFRYLSLPDLSISFHSYVWSKGNMMIELLCPNNTSNPIMIICENRPITAKLEREKRSNKASSATVTYSAEVKNSSWDGSVKQVKEYLNYNLRDPNSYESIEWSEVKRKDDGFYVRHKYRAKNSLGGYVVTNQLFHLDFSGKVVDVKDLY